MTARLVDYHIHTIFSDGIGRHEEYIREAERKNIDEIGFSEHLCLRDVEWTMDSTGLEEVVKKVEGLKKNAPIKIKLGLEIDYLPGYETRIDRIIKGYPFDYLIGSVHFINDWNFDSRKYIGEYQKWDIYELYKKYFRLIQNAARSQLFDIIGHADVIKKYGFRPEGDITDLLNETALVFKEAGACIEVNTNGLRKPCREIYPSQDFLKICFEKGIPVTLGSDAHRPEHVGQNFNQAIGLIRDIGYARIGHFDNRASHFSSI